jgi:hypothetical protein
MVECAALLVDEVLPAVPTRQWVLRVPFALRFLFAGNPAAMGEALRIVYRTISGFMIHKAGLTRTTGQSGAVTLVQRFGSALNLNVRTDRPDIRPRHTFPTSRGNPHRSTLVGLPQAQVRRVVS